MNVRGHSDSLTEGPTHAQQKPSADFSPDFAADFGTLAAGASRPAGEPARQ
jgi:hypothetical protein